MPAAYLFASSNGEYMDEAAKSLKRLFFKEKAMKLSARNQLKGKVVEVTKGATTSHVRVDIGGGQIMTSSITNEAVDELGIKAKGHVTVVVKASDVMIAVD